MPRRSPFLIRLTEEERAELEREREEAIYERLGLFSVYDSAWFAAIYTPLMVSLVVIVSLQFVDRHFVGGGALRQIRQDDSIVRAEDRRRDVTDRLRGDRQVARQHPVDHPGVVQQRGI